MNAARVLRDFESERDSLRKDDRKLGSIATRLAQAVSQSDETDSSDFWSRPGGLELRSVGLEDGGQTLVVTFVKGKSYRLPIERLKTRGRVESVRLDDVRHGILLNLRDGTTTDVASDFVLFEADARYRSLHAPSSLAARPSIGQNVRSIRLRQGRSSRDVAKAAGLAPSNFARLESGRHEPKIETLVKIARVLRVPLADLLSVS